MNPPSDFEESLAWWTPIIHLMVYALGWQSPASGLTAWLDAGRPLADKHLSLIEAIWGRHLDAVETYLWGGLGGFEEAVSSALGLPRVDRPAAPDSLAALPAASVAAQNPATGGSDPLHLTVHFQDPLEAPLDDEVVLAHPRSLQRTAGHATLTAPSYRAWYRELHRQGSRLPGVAREDEWRVDVVVYDIGILGTFRYSADTGRWYASTTDSHLLGVVR